MATHRAIIERALRDLQVTRLGETPTQAHLDDTAPVLNSFVESLLDDLTRDVVDPRVLRSSGGDSDEFLTYNTRTSLLLSGDAAFFIPDRSLDNGFVTLISGDPAAQHMVTLRSDSGYTIEGVRSLELQTTDLPRMWLHRGDLGDWLRVGDRGLHEEAVLGPQHTDFLAAALAVRLSSRYSVRDITTFTNVETKGMEVLSGQFYHMQRSLPWERDSRSPIYGGDGEHRTRLVPGAGANEQERFQRGF